MDNEFIDRAQLEEQARIVAEKEAAKKKKEKKAEDELKAVRAKKPSAFAQILNGDFLTKDFVLGNLNFIFFIMLLLILVIGKGYYAKQLGANVKQKQEELDEATGEYFEAKARLEENTLRSILIEKLDKSGLKETVNPTKVIRIETKKEQE